ncbi:MAG: dephospho-CoA kinase [Arenimonas sp.]|jgi:dephospho-CoA kinase|uniref:dephospho-CoA kinase n=1 Tax=Arenimonas sp. TaxID=1872635 RepID=UPI001B738A07|nr:dephospho-CoA kinase [Arenimonas sp.]
MPLRIAVAGGIAAGKSVVCRILQQGGAEIIDADDIARELVAPGMPALAEIAEQLGPQFIKRDGTLERAALRAYVFADAAAKTRLEAILHPPIQQSLQQRSSASNARIVAVAIPLLSPQSRAGAYGWLDRVLIVEAPPELQVARIRARDGSSEELATAMMAAQLDSAGRLPMADDVLINDGDLASLEHWTQHLLVRYRTLAAGYQ